MLYKATHSAHVGNLHTIYCVQLVTMGLTESQKAFLPFYSDDQLQLGDGKETVILVALLTAI